MRRKNAENSEIYNSITRALKHYFKDLDGEAPAMVYDMVIREVETSMFVAVLNHVDGNQTHAAEVLGISRNTLRRKLIEYELV
jgi:Fis family transcriptional regulator